MHFASGNCFPAEHTSWAVPAAAMTVWGAGAPLAAGQSSEVTSGQTGCSNSCPKLYSCVMRGLSRGGFTAL